MDYIAIGPRGVYAIHDADDSGAPRFVMLTEQIGHRVELVSVAEACDRHMAYLREMFPAEFPDAEPPLSDGGTTMENGHAE